MSQRFHRCLPVQEAGMTLRFVATKDWSGSSRLLRKKPALQSLWLWEQHWFCFRATAERPKYQVKNCLCVKTFQSISRDTVWCMNDFQTYTAELIAKAEPGRKRNLQIRKGNGKMKSILQRRKKEAVETCSHAQYPSPAFSQPSPFYCPQLALPLNSSSSMSLLFY